MQKCYTKAGGDKMQCDNRFCVYWSLKECTLDEVELDIQGNCLDCIYVDIDENLLIKKRYEMLKRFE